MNNRVYIEMLAQVAVPVPAAVVAKEAVAESKRKQKELDKLK